MYICTLYIYIYVYNIIYIYSYTRIYLYTCTYCFCYSCTVWLRQKAFKLELKAFVCRLQRLVSKSSWIAVAEGGCGKEINKLVEKKVCCRGDTQTSLAGGETIISGPQNKGSGRKTLSFRMGQQTFSSRGRGGF